MSATETSNSSWRIPLLLTAGVVLVVIIALILAQVDAIQHRSLLPPKRLPVVDIEATMVAGSPPRVYLPGDLSATPTPSTTPSSEIGASSEQSLATINASTKGTCTAEQKDWTPYTIQAEDSLSSLASHFGISKYDILQANCLAQEKLIAGHQILLPRRVPADASKEQCYPFPPPGWLQYRVRPGNKLQELADRYGTTVDQVMQVNCLDGAHVTLRRKIFLPPLLTPNSLSHRATPGATPLPSPS
jgi:LysM repeat protein